MATAQKATDRCTQYALDVVSGAIIAGELVILACQRHLDDLEKSKAAPYKYYFDVEKSEEIINFAEELTIAEGEDNENVTAYPFQCFILGSLNGWRTKEHSYRRFRTSYVQLGRQNGKSFLNGILAAYYGNFDGYKYGKIFCTATKQDQANIVFDEIVKFINSDEDLSEWFKVHEHNHTIECLLTHSEIKALSGDTKSLDGHRAYLGIVDEYHAHKTNQMYKLLEGGIKKLKSALISVITTAGFDLKSPCYKLYEYCCNLLRGVFENDSQFVYIAQIFGNRMSLDEIGQIDAIEFVTAVKKIHFIMQDIISEKLMTLVDTEHVEKEESAFDEYDLENGYEEEQQEENPWKICGEIADRVVKITIRLMKESYSQCMREDIMQLLDYLKFELETIDENQT